MSGLYEYLIEAREQDIKRRIERASARPSARDRSGSTYRLTTKEHR
jgi:hypothetical protein